MSYSELKVPFLSKEAIKNIADKFRRKHWNDKIPIDIEWIIDVKLGIDIVPTPGLVRLCNADALISSDWRSIYVDEGRFKDERYLNRLRFSLAHEIGHAILHRDIYSSLNIQSFEDFYRFIEEVSGSQYSYLETQANKFASFILVPRDKLEITKNNFISELKKSKEVNFNNLDISLLNSYLAIPISKRFGISAEAMEIILSESN